MTVRLTGPDGIGAARLLSRRDVSVPADRIVEMTESDARPLIGPGWVRIAMGASGR